MKQLEELFKRVTGKTFQEAADELNTGKTVEEFARDMAAHEALGKAKPEGCYCNPGQCMAPVIMGKQMPCRDPKKAHICGQPIGSGYHCEKPKGHGGSCNIVRSYTVTKP